MTLFKRRVLLAIRGLGPCSIADLKRIKNQWVDHPENSVYRSVYDLLKEGFVRRIRMGQYDLTRRGNEVASHEFSQMEFGRETKP